MSWYYMGISKKKRKLGANRRRQKHLSIDKRRKIYYVNWKARKHVTIDKPDIIRGKFS